MTQPSTTLARDRSRRDLSVSSASRRTGVSPDRFVKAYVVFGWVMCLNSRPAPITGPPVCLVASGPSPAPGGSAAPNLPHAAPQARTIPEDCPSAPSAARPHRGSAAGVILAAWSTPMQWDFSSPSVCGLFQAAFSLSVNPLRCAPGRGYSWPLSQVGPGRGRICPSPP